MSLRIVSACVSVGLFCWGLLLFFLGGSATATIVEELDAPNDQYQGGRYGTTTVALSCASLADMLAGHAGADEDALTGPGGGPQPDVPDAYLAGNDIARGQACANVRDARATSITLLAVPAVIAGVGAFTLPVRRRAASEAPAEPVAPQA